MQINWDALWSSGLGALLGSVIALVATYVSHRLQRSHQQENEDRLLHGILQAIHDEIETLWDNYMDNIGNRLEALADAQPLNLFWPVTQEYFTVYNTNAFFIGRVQDHDLRKLIVSTYSKARGLIDSYHLNNDLVQKHEHAFWMFQETQNQIHQANAASRYKALADYAKALRKGHTEVKTQVQMLLRELRKKGVLNQPQHAA